MFFRNGHLDTLNLEENIVSLFRQDATGASLARVGRLAQKYYESERAVSFLTFAATENWLYYTAEVDKVDWDEEINSFGNVREFDILCRLHLKTGKEELLIEEPIEGFHESLTLISAWENGALISHLEPGEISLDDPDKSAKLKAAPMRAAYWDGETKTVTTVLERTRQDFGGIIYQHEPGKLFFVSSKTNLQTIYDLATGTEETFADTLGSYLGDGWYRRTKKDTGSIELYRPGTGESQPYDLPKAVRIECVGETGFVICWFDLFPDSPDNPKESRYFYIPHQALKDGLQEADLLLLYTVRNTA